MKTLNQGSKTINKKIKQLKADMLKLQQAQAGCLDDYCIVKPYQRYKYQLLTRDIRALKLKIDTLEDALV